MTQKIKQNNDRLPFHIPLPKKMEMPTIVKIAERYLDFSDKKTSLVTESSLTQKIIKINPKNDSSYRKYLYALKGLSFVLFPIPLIALAIKAIYRGVKDIHIAPETEPVIEDSSIPISAPATPSISQDEIDAILKRRGVLVQKIANMNNLIERQSEIDPLSNRNAEQELADLKNWKYRLEEELSEGDSKLPPEYIHVPPKQVVEANPQAFVEESDTDENPTPPELPKLIETPVNAPEELVEEPNSPIMEAAPTTEEIVQKALKPEEYNAKMEEVQST